MAAALAVIVGLPSSVAPARIALSIVADPADWSASFASLASSSATPPQPATIKTVNAEARVVSIAPPGRHQSLERVRLPRLVTTDRSAARATDGDAVFRSQGNTPKPARR
jgi:hypothetical protein